MIYRGRERGGSISILENCTTGTKLFVIETHIRTGTEIGQYKGGAKLQTNNMKENWRSQESELTNCLLWMNCRSCTDFANECMMVILSHRSITIIICQIERWRTPCYHFGFMNNEKMSARIITLNNQVF